MELAIRAVPNSRASPSPRHITAKLRLAGAHDLIPDDGAMAAQRVPRIAFQPRESRTRCTRVKAAAVRCTARRGR